MLENLDKLSIGTLFGKLHNSIKSALKDISSSVEANNKINMYDIRELRNHINSRLSKNEDIEDNKKLMALLNLFVEDKAAMELLNEDTEEWLDLLTNIEKSLARKSGELTVEERKELEEISGMITNIKTVIRK